ncbi:hypothetical protein FA95DRAFT_1572737 [Auriscalpium vulgare]|uniref:Uncharacterized protein n=1 Tax=Auriscalpium vulgare TaxID=40419 RepID=A0ACB8RSM2_9AGAM|nr:hypothetical protein FA95DRAFT_1572737 [Auriscalpium vulgare]
MLIRPRTPLLLPRAALLILALSSAAHIGISSCPRLLAQCATGESLDAQPRLNRPMTVQITHEHARLPRGTRDKTGKPTTSEIFALQIGTVLRGQVVRRKGRWDPQLPEDNSFELARSAAESILHDPVLQNIVADAPTPYFAVASAKAIFYQAEPDFGTRLALRDRTMFAFNIISNLMSNDSTEWAYLTRAG